MEEWEMYNTSNRTITSGMSCSTSGKPNDELSREKATICRPLPNFSPCSDSGVPKGKSLTTYDEYGSLYEDRSRKRKSQYPEDPVPDASVTVPDHGNSGPSWCYGNSAKLWACDWQLLINRIRGVMGGLNRVLGVRLWLGSSSRRRRMLTACPIGSAMCGVTLWRYLQRRHGMWHRGIPGGHRNSLNIRSVSVASTVVPLLLPQATATII
jgi:hypothetical protein